MLAYPLPPAVPSPRSHSAHVVPCTGLPARFCGVGVRLRRGCRITPTDSGVFKSCSEPVEPVEPADCHF